MQFNGVDKKQADYWLGYISRKDAQKIFDEYGEVIQRQGEMLMALNLSVSYLMQLLGVKPEQVKEWIVNQAQAASQPTDVTPPVAAPSRTDA